MSIQRAKELLNGVSKAIKELLDEKNARIHELEKEVKCLKEEIERRKTHENQSQTI